MMRKAWLFTLLLFPLLMMAQQLKQQGKSVEALVPEGWEHMEAVGDLNKDGIQDLVIIATSNNEEKILVNETGYRHNMNPPHLAIYFGQSTGDYTLFKKYENLFPEIDEFRTINIYHEINDRGALRIGYSIFSSAGSSYNNNNSYVFRFQKGDFYLIGKDESGFSRYSGEATEVSENYITHKRQTKTYNVFEEHEGKENEKWTTIPRKPLQRLGTFEF